MTDFTVIRHGCGLLQPEETHEFHRRARAWLTEQLAEPFGGKTVVVTHHLPHRRSIHRDFRRHPLNPAFVSDLSRLVRSPVKL